MMEYTGIERDIFRYPHALCLFAYLSACLSLGLSVRVGMWRAVSVDSFIK